MKTQRICGFLFLIIGLILVFGISIWLGFPSTSFNKLPLAVVSYVFGTIAIMTSFPLFFGNFS